MPSFAWLDESVEHTEADLIRATALAKKWSSLQAGSEEKMFRRMSQDDDYFNPYEDCECAPCIEAKEDGCKLCTYRLADEAAAEAKQADQDLEIELIEDKLTAVGARMMRAYEHWNEDERYMQYQENRD